MPRRGTYQTTWKQRDLARRSDYIPACVTPATIDHKSSAGEEKCFVRSLVEMPYRRWLLRIYVYGNRSL